MEEEMNLDVKLFLDKVTEELNEPIALQIEDILGTMEYNAEQDEIESTKKFIKLIGLDETAKFIMNQNKTIKGLTENNDSFVRAYKKSS